MAEPNFYDLRGESTLRLLCSASPIADPDDPPPDITIILFIVAFSATSYRCFARYTGGIWWHDDSVALFSALFSIIYSIGSSHAAATSALSRTKSWH